MTDRRDVIRAGVVAATLSGAPSTAFALATGRHPLAAARAAATLVPGRSDRPSAVVGICVHLVVSAMWTAVFALAARARPMSTAEGAVGGLAIAALDLGVVAPRRYPTIAALPRLPQVLDHIAFGAILGHLSGAERSGKVGPGIETAPT